MRLAALLAAAVAATACGRFGFSAEPERDPDPDAAPSDGAPADSIGNAPCMSWLWQPTRVLDELDSMGVDWSYAWGQGMKQIVFESNRGANNENLFLAVLDEGTRRYRAPRALDEVNTPNKEAAPALSESGLELFYDSPTGLMRAVRDSPDAPFTDPTLLFAGQGADLGNEDRDLIYILTSGSGLRTLAVRTRASASVMQFSDPVRLDYLTLPNGSGWPSLSRDGLELFLEVPGQPIHTATRRDLTQQFSPLKPILTLGATSDPDISPDGQWLLYVVDTNTTPMLAHRTCLDGA